MRDYHLWVIDIIYIYIYIYTLPHGGWALWRRKLSAAARIFQSSSKELSTLLADRVLKCKQTDAAAVAIVATLKIYLVNVVRLWAEWSET